VPLTETFCRTAKPGAKPKKKSDGGGLYLLVTPDGAKYWRLAYRFNGRQRTLACGVYPDVSLADARRARDEARRQLAAVPPIDPSIAKRDRRQAAVAAAGNTFEVVAREWHEKRMATRRSAKLVIRRLEANVFPAIGKRPISEIEPPEVLDMLRKVEARGFIVLAHDLKQKTGQVFRYGIATGKAQRDPCADLKGALRIRPEIQHHKPMPTAKLPEFLRAIDTSPSRLRTRLGLRLIVLTFLRTTELRAAQWTEIEDLDGEAPLWRVPAKRMKMKEEHLVPLSRQAVAVLRELHAMSGSSRYIFPSVGKDRFMSRHTLLWALYSMGYQGEATIHGFRGCASTILNENNFNPDWIEKQLAHEERNKVRGAYNSAQWLPDRRRMMAWWADYLDARALEGHGPRQAQVAAQPTDDAMVYLPM
jgi:integrase